MKFNTNLKIGDLFKKILKPSQELTFLLAGVLIFIIIVWYLAGDISFLVSGFNSAFNSGLNNRSNQSSFNLEEARNVLKETKKQ